MPQDLQKHIRYPEDLFFIQAQVYRTYHMNGAEVFYNREDLWQFPRQPTGGDDATMAPYYIIVRLPGEARVEFLQMLPLVPSQRQNMIAWLAARSDPPDYGKLIVYEFPKDKLVYGPFQIEALINQNTVISQQLSLWNQMGSRVIRGNLLVIPIENSILYVSPLYPRAGAWAPLLRAPPPPAPTTGAPAETALAGAEADRAREALSHYNDAMQQL